MIDTLLSLIAPHLCVSCGQNGTVLCDNCNSDIIEAYTRQCIVCGESHMLLHNVPFNGAWYVGARKAVLQRLIGSYKFNGLRSAASHLAKLLAQTTPPLSASTIVTWIPTNPRHIRQRGYDHMRRIARLYAKKRNYHCEPLLLRRTNYVQHHSDRQTRLTQVVGAFEAAKALKPERTYIILDDIYTTGATVTEAARVLRAAGARSIYIGVIARQPLD